MKNRPPEGLCSLSDLAPLRAGEVAPEQVRELRLSFSAPSLPEPALWERMTALERVELMDCGLVEWPRGLERAPALRVLVLSGNALSPEALAPLPELRALERVELSGLGLRAWPTALDGCARLRDVDLSRNPLTDFSPAAESIARLVRLELSHGPLTEVPERLREASALEELSLGDAAGSLAAFAEGPWTWGALRSLSLRGVVARLPLAAETWTRLETLDLRGLPVDDELWERLRHLAALRVLVIAGTQVTRIPDEVGELTSLETLDARGAPIRAVSPALWALPALRRLNLEGAAEPALPELGERAPPLEQLWLARAGLTRLPAELGALGSLRELDLDDNALTELPESAAGLTSLELLSLSGNRFHAQGLARLDALEAAMHARDPFARVHRPRADAPLPPPLPRSLEPLSGACRKALESLGVARDAADSAPPETWETALRPQPLPESLRELKDDWRWPGPVFDHEAQPGWWSVDFSKARPIPDFECSASRPLVCIGEMLGGNDLILAALDDEQPADPELFRIDHDDAHELEAEPLGLRLSEFLRGLRRCE